LAYGSAGPPRPGFETLSGKIQPKERMWTMSVRRRVPLAAFAYLALLLGLLAARFLFWFMPNFEARVNLVYLWPCAITAFVLGLGLSAERRFKTVWLAYALTVWLLAVNVINGDYGFEYNLKFCLGILASIGVGFPLFFLWDRARFDRVLTVTGGVYIFMLLALALVSLYAVATRRLLTVPFTDAVLGIRYNRLYVFGYHPNEVASAFSVALYLSLVFLLRSKRAWVKVLFTVTALAFYAAISLTDSRTILFTVSAACGACATLAAYGHLPVRKKAFQRLLALLLGLLVAAVLLFGFQPTMTFVSTAGSAQAEASETAEPTATPEARQPEARSLLENAATLTGRTDIWKAAFTYIKQNPSVLLTGATDAVVARVPNRILGVSVYHFHDVWVEMLMLGGIPGFVLYLLLIVTVLIADFRLLKTAATPLYLRFLAVATLAMMLNGVTEIYPGVSGNVMDIMFFILCGAVVSKAQAYRAKASATVGEKG